MEIRCPDCNSTQLYHRTRTHSFKCVKCGEEYDEDVIKKKTVSS